MVVQHPGTVASAFIYENLIDIGARPKSIASGNPGELARNGRGAACGIFLALIIVGVIGSVLAVVYFLPESGTEELLVLNGPGQPADPVGPNSENQIPERGSNLTPSESPARAPLPTVTPTPCKPTPTLTLNEIFEKNSSGELTDEEAVQELEVRSSRIPESCQSIVLSIPPSSIPTIAPTAAPAIIFDSPRGGPQWITVLETRIHQLVNVERQQNSLSALSHDPALAEVARGHSEDMALNNFFEHENLAGLDATDRGEALGYTCLKDFGDFYTLGIAENIFQGYLYSSFSALRRNYVTLEELATQVVDRWMNSPGHRESILTETYDREGIGVVISADESVWVTQNFC